MVTYEIFKWGWFLWCDDEDSDNEIEEVGGLKEVERRQLKQVMKESHEMTKRSTEGHTRDVGGVAVVRSLQDQGSNVDCVRVLPLKKLKFQHMVLILTCSQQNRNKSKAFSQLRMLKKLERPFQKFFHYNAIPFNAADSDPYYQVMINTIVEAGSGVKDPTGY